MDNDDVKSVLLGYLQRARDAVLTKLDGLTEYDLRRPLTDTGTNLLGLVKHLAVVDGDYLGVVFDRPLPDRPAWFDSEEVNADLWARPDESSAAIVGLYRRVWAHGDQTVAALDLRSPGTVPWWGDQSAVTLGRILVHLTAETNRHAGHADIVRELIDGVVGMRGPGDNLPETDWRQHRERLEQAARSVGTG